MCIRIGTILLFMSLLLSSFFPQLLQQFFKIRWQRRRKLHILPGPRMDKA